jgi:threonine aldolase
MSFHLWPHTQDEAAEETLSIRLVCGWDTRLDDVTGALRALS